MKASVTVTDVAKIAGVSIQTVSRVLNQTGQTSQATWQRVHQAIEQLGYRPNHIARGLATNRTFTLGLIVPDITNPFFPDIVRGAEQVDLEHGYTSFLCNTNEHPEREMTVLAMLESHCVDGIILSGSQVSDKQLLPHLGRHRAVVLINRQSSFDRVNYAEGTQLAVAYLQAGQRRRIGFLSGPWHSLSRQTRLHTFSQAMYANGTQFEPSHSISCAPTSEGGHATAHDLLTQHPDLDELLYYNNLVAIGALHTCADLGAQAVNLLLKRIAGDHQETELVLSPHLIVRASAP